MSAELVVLCGLPGSGKSTWCREHLADTHVLVSKDLMGGSPSKEARQQREVRAALAANHPVVVDNTNLTRASRADLLVIAREFGLPCRAIVVRVPLTLALARNAERTAGAHVPEGIVRQMAGRWDEPTIEEGFASVEYADGQSFPTTPTETR